MDKRNEPSVWKKEISFRRKPKAARDVPAAPNAEPSIWKKEITFGRKPKTDPPVPVASPPAVPAMPRSEPAQRHDHLLLPTSTVPPLVQAPVPAPDVEPAAPAAPVGVPVTQPPSTPPVASWPAPEPVLEPVEPEPTPAAPAPEQAKLSRSERRSAEKSAERLAKEQAKRAKAIAKQDRKSLPRKHNRVVGLKIGASQIAAAEVLNKSAPRIVRMARMPLARGVVVGGELREPDELAAALKTFFRKNNLSRTCVRLGVANNRIGVRTFEISGIDDEKQLANAIRFRAQETLPIPLDEAVLDYRILDDRLDAEGVRVRRVLLVVAHRELVERYVAACKKAGLKLIGIDLEAFALLRALAEPVARADDAAFVCVTIGHDRSTLAVSDGRVCEFTRVLAWGGSLLDVALARVLDTTPSGAEPIRQALSLDDQGEGAGLDAERAGDARRAIVTELQGFAREIVASLRFYQEQPNSLGISEIVVTGGTSESAGLAEELGRLIGLPVRVADPLARVKVPRKLRQNGSAGSLAVAVGLGIEA